ncbi:MAG: S8 family serine peptidase [Candidatus Sericytochromatia bacterium]|nr:S8 family serine peptidase [Candidatus Tanganyikabacteria bacterium]
MKPATHKPWLSLAALIAASGCAATTPTAPLQAPGVGSGPGGKTDRDTQSLFPAGMAPRVIVRYKAGREMRMQALGGAWRDLTLPRTAVRTLDAGADLAAEVDRLQADPDVEYAEPDWPMTAFLTPDDPQASGQWAIGKLQLPAAWDVTRGTRDIKVAIVDSGIDARHPDLAGQVVGGRDFANNDGDPHDDQGHGTHVAGIVAALTDNGVGVAGTAGGASLLAVKVLGANGEGYTSAIAEGVQYAVAQGAKVVNMSLGAPQRSTTLDAAIAAAINAGVVVVAAAGNDGTTTPNYPGASPGVVAVGSSDSGDNRSTFSNHGAWVHVAAPGSAILSTFPGSRYQTMNGTSMAAPYVAGVAALVRSAHPDWSVAQVKAALTTTGDPVRGFESNPRLRRVNALSALNADPAAAPPPAPAPTAPPPIVAPTPRPWPTVAPPVAPTPRPWPTYAPPTYPWPTPRPWPSYAPPTYPWPTPRPWPTYAPPTTPWPAPTAAPTYPWPSPWNPWPWWPGA